MGDDNHRVSRDHRDLALEDQAAQIVALQTLAASRAEDSAALRELLSVSLAKCVWLTQALAITRARLAEMRVGVGADGETTWRDLVARERQAVAAEWRQASGARGAA